MSALSPQLRLVHMSDFRSECQRASVPFGLLFSLPPARVAYRPKFARKSGA
jgi:hypothetical protein